MDVRTPHGVLEQVPRYVCNTCGHWAASRFVIERVEAVFGELPDDPASARVTTPEISADWVPPPAERSLG